MPLSDGGLTQFHGQRLKAGFEFVLPRKLDFSLNNPRSLLTLALQLGAPSRQPRWKSPRGHGIKPLLSHCVTQSRQFPKLLSQFPALLAQVEHCWWHRTKRRNAVLRRGEGGLITLKTLGEKKSARDQIISAGPGCTRSFQDCPAPVMEKAGLRDCS